MVRRSDKAVGDTSRKKPAKGIRGRRQKHGKGQEEDMLEVQQRGVLNLKNPLIPPELDEDIDDDFAFNSDDEEKYGHFFKKKATVDTTGVAKTKKSKTKKATRHGADLEEGDESEEAIVLQQLRALGEIDDDDDLDFHDKDGGGDDDDEYIDLVDMLDAGNREEEKGTSKKKKSKKKVDEDGVVKKRRRAPVTEEAESIYGSTAIDSTYSSAIREVVAATPASSMQSRMKQSLENKQNLITVDVEEHKKAALTRSEVRKVVEDDLSKYNSFLREQRESKHVQLPMSMPDSNPVPKSLGAIAAAAKDRFLNQDNAKDAALTSTETQEVGDNVTRVAAFRFAGRVNALLSSAGLSKPELSAPSAEDGVVPFGDDDNNDDNQRGSRHGDNGNVPTRGYIAKLKAMLSSENARRRRMNRIKSKTYRRILRKEKERERERREKAFELLHPEKARARLAEKLLKARVEERVTQKHKNTSKWVRHAKRFVKFDENTKDAINEQNLLHQKLMQKMEEDADEDEFLNAGGDGRADSEAVSSEEERVVDYLIAEATATQEQEKENGETSGKKKNVSSLLWKSVDDVEEGGIEAAVPGMTPTEKARVELRQMKFMQQARQREEKRYAEVLQQLQTDIRRDMCGEAVSSSDEPSDLDESVEGEKKKVKRKIKLSTSDARNVGRKAFLQKSDGRKSGETLETIHLKQHCGIDAQAGEDEVEKESCCTLNEKTNDEEKWSIRDGGSSDGDGDESKQKAVDSVDKSIKKGSDVKDMFAPSFLPNVSSVSSVVGSATSPVTRKRTTSTRITILPADVKRTRGEKITVDDSKEGVRAAQEEGRVPNMKTVERENREEYDNDATLQQQQDYLIARAFADDEVDADFLAEKTAQVETIMKPVDKNATLPGWGEWGGADERLNTRHQAKLQAMELQRQIEKTTLFKSRADAELDHVIINHDGVELVPDRMLLHMIPRPFSNPTEFARSMRHPHGPEWNTALTFKDANQPRVEVRQGHAVLPLDLSLRNKKKIAKTKRRKTVVIATS